MGVRGGYTGVDVHNPSEKLIGAGQERSSVIRHCVHSVLTPNMQRPVSCSLRSLTIHPSISC